MFLKQSMTLQGYVMSILVLIIRRSSFLSRSESKRREPSYRNRATVKNAFDTFSSAKSFRKFPHCGVSACEHLPDPVSAALPHDKFPVLLMPTDKRGSGSRRMSRGRGAW